ncbi:methyl-accepting chemotaxis protein [Velocimicrobium porci]|uniref:Methyl-accepting chemotaxis protein n=1 Tax=Velocimicrobium porci TaxID=2606634 RepID=A0A6L5Y0M8_9FIRM|nr:methyl-accepting chemotaxis protein [Velocimicrobium porci]MSS64680.1 methyl-accepting chemotaxis protein [Velocimicrobium porci]
MKGEKSISSYLIKRFCGGVAISFIIIFVATFQYVKNDMVKIKEESVTRLVEDANDNLLSDINNMFSTAKAIAADSRVYTAKTTFKEKKKILEEYAKTLEINSIGYITTDGQLKSTDGFESSISDREYFKNMMNGKTYISNPSFNTETNQQIIFIGVPLYENGTVSGAITCTFDSSYLSDLITDLKYMGSGEASIISGDGVTIASLDMEQVHNQYNVIEAAKEDASLKESADVYQSILDGESGNVELDGNVLFYKEVENTNGWTMVFKINKSDFAKEVNGLYKLFIIFGTLGVLLVILITVYLGNKLGKRLIKLKGKLEELEQGNFNIELDQKELEKKDEIGVIYKSVDSTVKAIKDTLISVKNIMATLSAQMEVLEETSNTLETSTKLVSTSLSEITTGNSEQSKEIYNINIEMENFNVNIEKVDTNIGNVASIASETNEKLESGKQDMQNLQQTFESFNENFNKFNEVIQNMNQSITSISSITSTIGEIASQTNLLSLNASIEAARAGEVGRGFSVVAQEIGQLAEQSEKSVSEIGSVVSHVFNDGQQLIHSTELMNEQMSKQRNTIVDTLESFGKLSEDIEAILPQISNISAISNENIVTSKNIGCSIENANAISEELAATTQSVAETSESFGLSSQNVSEASEKILALSKELEVLLKKFIVE